MTQHARDPDKRPVSGRVESRTLPHLSLRPIDVDALLQDSKFEFASLPSGAFEEDRPDGGVFVVKNLSDAVVARLVIESFAKQFLRGRCDLFSVHRADVVVGPKSREITKLIIEITFRPNLVNAHEKFAEYLRVNQHTFPTLMSKFAIQLVGECDFRDSSFQDEKVPLIEIKKDGRITESQRARNSLTTHSPTEETWFSVLPDVPMPAVGKGKKEARAPSVMAFEKFKGVLFRTIADRAVGTPIA